VYKILRKGDLNMRAILIDAENQEIREVDYNGDWKTIAEWIGGGTRTFTTIELNPYGDTAYVDDEGLYNGADYGFIYDGYPTSIVGNALILGTDLETGESIPLDALVTLEAVWEKTRFTYFSKEDTLDESMDGDHESALASAGFGTDEDYGGGERL
tara:strand:- start:292 stop:759 length:468 start_codon:yes stop_codon:yes gene_type:complete